jgi:hypothetical protein
MTVKTYEIYDKNTGRALWSRVEGIPLRSPTEEAARKWIKDRTKSKPVYRIDEPEFPIPDGAELDVREVRE